MFFLPLNSEQRNLTFQKVNIFSIFQTANFAGGAIVGIVGPLAVPFDEPMVNRSSSNDSSLESNQVPEVVVSSDAEREETVEAIHRYMICLAIIGGAIFTLILVYFPDRPRRPPSTTAMVKRSTGNNRKNFSFKTGMSPVSTIKQKPKKSFEKVS